MATVYVTRPHRLAATNLVAGAVSGERERAATAVAALTDFGQLAKRAGIDLWWAGGAWAYHQHHATETPPVRHLADILRNAALFHRRWGWWPMSGWLAAFAERGLARHDPATDRWVAV